MTAREWKPGDKALVEVEVEIADPLAARVTIADDPGYWVATEALRPVGDVDEVTARDELVTLLGEHRIAMVSFSYATHPICDGCEWSSLSSDPDDVMDEFNAHLADVLLASGWTKGNA